MELFEKVPLFNALKTRMSWVSKRQEVLAQNIANADTPEFKAKDLKPLNFKDVIRDKGRDMQLARTGPSHLSGLSRRLGPFRDQEERNPYETKPDGNSVVIEEQMAKVNESQVTHRLTSQLYKKHLSMLRMAINNR